MVNYELSVLQNLGTRKMILISVRIVTEGILKTQQSDQIMIAWTAITLHDHKLILSEQHGIVYKMDGEMSNLQCFFLNHLTMYAM